MVEAVPHHGGTRRHHIRAHGAYNDEPGGRHKENFGKI